MEFTLRQMDRAGLRALYPTMRRDFPRSELKPLKKLEKLLRQGRYEAWTVMEGERPRGYAMVLKTSDCPFVLLDYLAVFPGQRGGGFGTQAIKLLQAQYPQGILAEVEAELPEGGAENETRRRRIAFYQKNGFVPCPFDNCVFGVKYLIHLWTAQPVEDPVHQAAQGLLAHYRSQLPPVVFHTCVQVEDRV